jgi:hypothetical protein
VHEVGKRNQIGVPGKRSLVQNNQYGRAPFFCVWLLKGL